MCDTCGRRRPSTVPTVCLLYTGVWPGAGTSWPPVCTKRHARVAQKGDSLHGHHRPAPDAQTWPRLTLLGTSKTCRKGTLYTTLEGQRDQGYASSDANSNEVG